MKFIQFENVTIPHKRKGEVTVSFRHSTDFRGEHFEIRPLDRESYNANHEKSFDTKDLFDASLARFKAKAIRFDKII